MKLYNRLNSLAITAVLSIGLTSAFAASSLTDSQIAEIVHSANQVDIDAAKVAKSKTQNDKVKDFADLMTKDHGTSQVQVAELISKLNIKLAPSKMSKNLDAGDKSNQKKLKKLKGAAFDKAYVDHEVSFHESVADTIDKTLIPNAQNPELKTLLEQTLSVVRAHLEHAKVLQTAMK